MTSWTATLELRVVRARCFPKPEDHLPLMREGDALEQLYVSDAGDQEWRRLPVVVIDALSFASHSKGSHDESRVS